MRELGLLAASKGEFIKRHIVKHLPLAGCPDTADDLTDGTAGEGHPVISVPPLHLIGVSVGVAAVVTLEVDSLDRVIVFKESTVRLDQKLGRVEEMSFGTPVVGPPVHVLAQGHIYLGLGPAQLLLSALGAAHQLDTIEARALKAAGTAQVGLLTESACVGAFGAEHWWIPLPTKVVVDLRLEGGVEGASGEGLFAGPELYCGAGRDRVQGH